MDLGLDKFCTLVINPLPDIFFLPRSEEQINPGFVNIPGSQSPVVTTVLLSDKASPANGRGKKDKSFKK